MKKVNSGKSAKKESNFDRFKNMIKGVTKRPLQSVIVPLELIEYAGETQKAVFLARLLFLSDKGKKANGFIWKSYPDWKKEIGLSQSQIERIVEDFEKRGILEAKKMMAVSRNGNASNTWHYRISMPNLLADFKEFLLVREETILVLEPEEISDSITENTNIDSPKLVPLCEKVNSYEEVKEKENKNIKEENLPLMNEKESSNFFDSDEFSAFADGEADESEIPEFSGMDGDGELIYLSKEFQPTIEDKIWAITNFPYKSPQQVTQGLIRYFTEEKGKNTKKTIKGWSQKWRDFVETQKTIGATRESFEDEHNKIKNELFNLIYNFIGDGILVHEDLIYEEFYQKKGIDKQLIEDFLDLGLKTKVYSRFFKSYYNLEYWEDEIEWKEEIDLAMLNYIKDNDFDDWKPYEIYEFIKSEKAISEEQINKRFHGYRTSIKQLLKVLKKFRILTLTGDYYHESLVAIKKSSDSEEVAQQKYRRIKNKLAGLGIDYEEAEIV